VPVYPQAVFSRKGVASPKKVIRVNAVARSRRFHIVSEELETMVAPSRP